MVKKSFLRFFARCSLYKALSKIVLNKPFTMALYSLISCNRFTQKFDCFQKHSDIFLFLKHIMKQVKTSGKCFYEAKIFGEF